MQVTVWQAVLIALCYYLSQSPWLAGLGFWIPYRPLIAGFLTGLILGDPVQGTIIGATINLIYLGFISAGGALPGDPALAGYIATTLALTSSLDPQAAMALAVPIGLLGTLIWFGRMTVDSAFVHLADAYAEKGNLRGVVFANVVPPQIFLFIISFVPVYAAALYGPPAVQGAITVLGGTTLHVLSVIGGMLPAVGIAMNMRAIMKPAFMPYLLIGFALPMFFNIHNMVIIGLLGALLAALHLQFSRPTTPGGGVQSGLSN